MPIGYLRPPTSSNVGRAQQRGGPASPLSDRVTRGQAPSRREEWIEDRTGVGAIDGVFASINQLADPFLNAPPPEQGTAGRVAHRLNQLMTLVGGGAQFVDAVASAAFQPLAAITPALPAATIGALHLGTPHAHMHPPSFVPPAPPLPLPSLGPILLSGCASVLINNLPALRCGDVGIGLTCGSLGPPIEVMTGSSNVFIGGQRAARVSDLTVHCMPGGATAVVGQLLGAASRASAVVQQVSRAERLLEAGGHALGAAGLVAGGAQSLAQLNQSDAQLARGRSFVGRVRTNSQEGDLGASNAAAGEALNAAAEGAALAQSAALMAAQTALDAAAMAMKMLMGKDPGIPPGVGMLMPHPAAVALAATRGPVLIGGFPLPALGEAVMGDAFDKLKRMLLRGFDGIGRPHPTHGLEGAHDDAHPCANGTCDREGHPVNVVTGHTFDAFTDFVTPGAFAWQRLYDSRGHRDGGVFGPGFRHALDHRLHVRLHRLEYTDPEGRRVAFAGFRPGGHRTVRHGYVVERVDRSRYRVSHPGKPTLEFDVAPFERDARLLRMSDEGWSLTLDYEPGGTWIGWTEATPTERPHAYRLRYDEAGRIIAVERRGGEQGTEVLAAYAYDRYGCLSAARNALGHEERFAYDESRRLARWTDATGYAFSWRYDREGRCVWTEGSDGLFHVELAYAPEKNETVARRGDGGTWRYQYNGRGVITRIEGPYGSVFTREVDADARTVAEVDWGGRTWRWLYDAHGAHTGRLDPFGTLLPPEEELPEPPEPVTRALPASPGAALYPSSDVPDAGRAPGLARPWRDRLPPRIQAAAAEPFLWEDGPQPTPSYAVDAVGRTTVQRDGRGEQRWGYDPTGRTTHHVDREGRSETTPRDRWGLIAATVDPEGRAVRFAYSNEGLVTRILDPGGTASDYRYDERNRLVAIWRGGVLRDRYAWDALDRLTEKYDGEGRRLLQIEPHASGFPGVVELASGDQLSFDYDEHGHVRRAETRTHKAKVQRDGLGRRVFDLRGDRGVVHHYAPDGTHETRVFGRFSIHTRTVDSGGVEIRGPSGRAERVEWDSSGGVLRETPGGTTELLQYDPRGRQVARASWRRGGENLWTTRYRRSREAELLRVEDSERGAVDYLLDGAGRLVATRDAKGHLARYTLDDANNLREAPGVGPLELTECNRLLRAGEEHFVYNARGHVAVRERANGAWFYRYDSLDQLVEAHWEPRGDEAAARPARSWHAEYDALGRRVAKAWGEKCWAYWWDGDRLAAERRPDGEVRVFVYASATVLTPLGFVSYAHEDAEPSEGVAYSLQHDALGMPLRIEREDGTTVWSAARTAPYGGLAVAAGAQIAYEGRWPGHWWDEEIGLQYNRFRYYLPKLGRYLQEDPLDTAGGINTYAYGDGNPCDAIDFLGLACKKPSAAASGNGAEAAPVAGQPAKPDPAGTARDQRGVLHGKGGRFAVDPRARGPSNPTHLAQATPLTVPAGAHLNPRTKAVRTELQARAAAIALRNAARKAANRRAHQHAAEAASQRLGELASASYMKTVHPDAVRQPQDRGGAGRFDGVYENPEGVRPRYLLVEDKGGSATNSSSREGPHGTNHRYQQGTPEYRRSVINEMVNSSDPETRALGRRLRTADPEDIQYIEVSQPIKSDGTLDTMHARQYGDTSTLRDDSSQ